MKITRKQFLKGLGATMILGTGTVGYTLFIEPHWLDVAEHALPIRNLPDSWNGRKVVLLSDLHIGPRVSDDYLRRSFAVVDSLAPDLVVYTGDFTDREPDVISHARAMFKYLAKGKLGTFGILGNHDYGKGWHEYDHADQIAGLAEANGVRILRNETQTVDGLTIAGLDDLWARRFHPEKVIPSLTADQPAIVLSHNPDTVDLPVWGDFKGWIFAGHTHGGQCKPPFLPPPLLPVENRRYTSGMFDLFGDRKMYISKGLGHLIQARFNVRPEITVFTLTKA